MEEQMTKVVIGVDPHKRSNTAVVIDAHEKVLAQERFDNDRDGNRALRKFARRWSDRTWAVEGAKGCGLGLAQRLTAEGERVLSVPAKMSARVRALDGGDGRKTDDTDAYAVAVAGLRGRHIQLVTLDGDITILKMLADRREQLVAQRIAAINRLHQTVSELKPGGHSGRLSATKARVVLSGIRPRDAVGKARKNVALDHLADLEDLDAKLKAMKARITAFLADKPSVVQDITGFGPVLTAVALGEAGDVRRFPNKHHFASYTGTSPMEASSGDYPHHYVNRGGNRRLNHVLHIAAVVQISHPGPGQDYYRRKRAEGKSPLEAIRALKRRLSDVLFRALVADHQRREAAGPEGHSGATLTSSATDLTPVASSSDKSLTGPARTHATPRRARAKVSA
jgi:transposase